MQLLTIQKDKYGYVSSSSFYFLELKYDIFVDIRFSSIILIQAYFWIIMLVYRILNLTGVPISRGYIVVMGINIIIILI